MSTSKFSAVKGMLRPTMMAGAVALAMSAAPAMAALSVGSQFFPGNVNQLSDNSAETLIKGYHRIVGGQVVAAVATDAGAIANTGTQAQCGGISPASDCIEIGDRVRGILEFETIEDLTSGGGTRNFSDGGVPGVNALNGIFDTTVLGFSAVGGLLNYFFGPSAGFAASLPGGGAGVSAGAMIALYDDPNLNYGRTNGACADIATCEFNASEGSLFATFGFGKDAGATNSFGGQGDELWAVLGARPDYGVFQDVSAGTGLGEVRIQVSLIDNYSGLTFLEVNAGLATGTGDGRISTNGIGNVIAIGQNGAGQTTCGQIDILTGNVLDPCTGPTNTPFGNFDNIDVVIRLVPEPGTVALLGLGLLGLGAAARRKPLPR